MEFCFSLFFVIIVIVAVLVSMLLKDLLVGMYRKASLVPRLISFEEDPGYEAS